MTEPAADTKQAIRKLEASAIEAESFTTEPNPSQFND